MPRTRKAARETVKGFGEARAAQWSDRLPIVCECKMLMRIVGVSVYARGAMCARSVQGNGLF